MSDGHDGLTVIGPVVTNGALSTINFSCPYIVRTRIAGTTDFLFHKWNCEAVEAKSRAAKGSRAKKTDDIETYVYRNDRQELCIPGEYVRQAIINAAKFRQDPRSPRKSAMDLYKAGILALTPLATLGVTVWDYEHRCRVKLQQNSITRCRPAMKAGWTMELDLMVNLPEYIPADALHDVLVNAGRLIGIGDFRPTYGRFGVRSFDAVSEESALDPTVVQS
jgi:hypothetical protein